MKFAWQPLMQKEAGDMIRKQDPQEQTNQTGTPSCYSRIVEASEERHVITSEARKGKRMGRISYILQRLTAVSAHSSY